MTNAGRPLRGHTLLTVMEMSELSCSVQSRFAENRLEFADYMHEVVIVVCI
jgi:hypothetical protein